MVRRERALPPEELVTLIKPVERVLGAVLGGEGELGEARRRLGMTAVGVRLGGAEQRRRVGDHRGAPVERRRVEANVGARGAGGPAVLRLL